MTDRLGVWVLAVGIAAGAIWVITQGERPPPPIAAGIEAPGFSLPKLDGETVALEDLRGQVVLVNFWATWCKPCEDEMPAMERLYQQLAPEGFEMLAVSVDDGPEPVREFQERLALSFPILLDPEKSVAETYQAFRFPETVLVARDGTLAARYIGPREWDDPAYVERIRRLLGDGE